VDNRQELSWHTRRPVARPSYSRHASADTTLRPLALKLAVISCRDEVSTIVPLN
jgi:hypothetical protein